MSNCNANEAANKIVSHMQSEREDQGEDMPTAWAKTIQLVGFPAVAAIAIAWFANETIRWEREQMLPAIQKNTTAFETNTQALNRVQESLDRQIVQLKSEKADRETERNRMP